MPGGDSPVQNIHPNFARGGWSGLDVRHKGCPSQRGDSLIFGGADVLIWGRRNYLESKISRSQMCYLLFETWVRLDYLGSDISSMALSNPFF